MAAYYNEIDPKAAAWLRELIKRDLIAPGEVDERSILDVRPSDLDGFTQCHFFAGIGVWSYALRRAGWPDDRPVWTGSCPCQPFSAAGKGGGFDDERHLWPAFNHLIGERRPGVVFGEQVASKDGLAWLDLVQVDMEGKDYAFGAFDLCAAGFGAPHIRQRTYWVAESDNAKRRADGARGHDPRGHDAGRPQGSGHAEGRGAVGGLADSDSSRRGAWGSSEARDGGGPSRVEPSGFRDPRVALGDADQSRLEGWRLSAERARELFAGQTGVAGHWSNADWLYCRDGKYRPVEPGTFPLAHGAPARMGRLRGYGNAIVAPVAQEFIEAYMTRSDAND